MPVERPPRARTWVVDVVAATAVVAFLVLATSHLPVDPGDRGIDVFGLLLLVAAGASLALCRRHPHVAVALVSVALSAYVLRHYAGGPIFVTAWVSLFFLSRRGPRRTAVLAAVGLCAALLVSGLLSGTGPVLLHLVFVGWTAAALFLGEAVRNRRSYLVELEERAHHLERTREEEARRRVAEDRLRIARDLHDSVAHAMATINVQAGAAAHVVDRRPGAAQEALAAIQRASGDVLDELAAMLALLREDDLAAGAGGEDRAPTPGLAQIPDLVDSMRATELPVRLETDGDLGGVPKPVGTAAYRIVQESLTNVLRHAGGARTTVALRAADGHFTVRVADEGPGDVGAGDRAVGSRGLGVGIRGMRERAEATGGTLAAGAGPSGRAGFVVLASWPVAP